MPDMMDEAQALTDLRNEQAIAQRRTLTIPFSGFCLHCKEPVEERRFCDSDCREAHEHKVRRNFGIR